MNLKSTKVLQTILLNINLIRLKMYLKSKKKSLNFLWDKGTDASN